MRQAGERKGPRTLLTHPDFGNPNPFRGQRDGEMERIRIDEMNLEFKSCRKPRRAEPRKRPGERTRPCQFKTFQEFEVPRGLTAHGSPVVTV